MMVSQPAEPLRIWILGVGMGPRHVTLEVSEVLRTVDYVLAAEKDDDDGLLALRRAIVATHAGPDGPAEIVAVRDPQRDRSAGLSAAGYENAVADWHRARAQAYAEVLTQRGGTAAFLVWGDPSLYDSTIRIVEQIRALGVHLEYQVLPGISAPQLLAARHRIVLHEVGRPVHITTGRRLQQAVAQGMDNIVAMLNPPPDQLGLSGLGDWELWWGANLGATGERLVAGQLDAVYTKVVDARREAKTEAGWVMDVYLLRRPN